MRPRWQGLMIGILVLLPGVVRGAESRVQVRDDRSLRTALRQARPGTRIQIAPGRYQPGVYAASLEGTAAEPIVIEGADPPVFEGGSQAWHLSDCRFVTLRNIALRGQKVNGINVGPKTKPETFAFRENLWYCEDRPQASKPVLPAAETGGLYGLDPRLSDPQRSQFQVGNPQAARFGAFALAPQR